MKKWIAAAAAVLAIITWSGAEAAHAAMAQQSSLKLVIKGTPVPADSAPIGREGRVFVPVRVVTEMLGGKVAWDTAKQTVTVSKRSDSVELTIGQKTATLHIAGSEPRKVTLDASAKLVQKRVYVPLRFVSEMFGYPVDWDGSTASVRSPLSAAQSAILAEGSLTDARQLVIDQVIGDKLQYEQEPLAYRFESEYMGYTVLFPEGEALRGYLIRGNTVSRFEFKDDFPVAVWQARVKEDNSLDLFLQGKWTEAKGDNPKIGKAYYAYSAGGWGDSWNEECGRIDLNGQFAATGYKRIVGGGVTDESGQIVYAYPDEQRAETVKFTKPVGGPDLP